MSKHHNNTEINDTLKRHADALLYGYVDYFGDEYATISINQKKKTLIKSSQEIFAENAFRLIFKSTESSLLANYKKYWKKNSSIEILKHDIKHHFCNAIFEIFSNNFKQALLMLLQEGKIYKEELAYFVQDSLKDILVNYKNYDNDEFARKTIDNINKTTEDSNDPINVGLNDSLKGLLFRITERRIIDAQRKLKREVELFDHNNEAVEMKPALSFSESSLNRDEHMEDRSPILYQLSRKDQIFMALFYRLVPEKGQNRLTNIQIAQIFRIKNLDYPAVRRNKNIETLKAIVSGKKKRKDPALPEFKWAAENISKADDDFMKELILVKQDEKANEIFDTLFKATPEFNALIRWDWIWNPTDAQIALVFEIEHLDQVQGILNYYKLALLKVLLKNK